MARFRLSKDTVSAGSLTSRERRELRHLEHRAEREREALRHDQERVEKAREMRKSRVEQGTPHHGGRGRLLLILLIIAAIAYAYLKYFRK